jgi:hypothetical protein
MYVPYNRLVISNNTSQLDLSRLAHGRSWDKCREQHAGAGQRGLLERSDLSLTHEVQWQDEIMTKLRQTVLYSGGYDPGTLLGPQTPLLQCHQCLLLCFGDRTYASWSGSSTLLQF